MRGLSVYRYCTAGGVETGMRSRMDWLSKHDVELDAWFFGDHGGRATFEGMSDRAFFGSRAQEFAERLRAGRYDFVTIIDSFLVLDWLREAGYRGKVVVELRSTYERTLRELTQLKGHRLDAVLVPSRFQQENVRGWLPPRIRKKVPSYVAHNFIDTGRFRYRPSGVDPRDRKVVCWVGRFDPLKNWSEFLEIAERLADRADVEFWMVGGGRSEPGQRHAFRRSLNGTQLASKLRWWPAVPNHKMPALYSLVADTGGIAMVTTKCESFGFVALEAAACGCPVVAPSVGAIPEVIENDTSGLLYESGNIEEAAAQVSRLLDDSIFRERIAKQGVERAQEHFSQERGAERFAEVLKTIVGSNADRG